MNFELEIWKENVMENCHTLETVAKDKAIIKNVMEKYLRQFFDFDRIDFDENLNKITIKWKVGVSPVIKIDTIKDFDMDFIITCDYDEDLGTGVWIEFYPFGMPEGIVEY